jgi:hypothetical protein
MAKRKPASKKTKENGNGEIGGIVALTKELFQAAIMRASSSIAFVFSGFRPADPEHGDELCKTIGRLWLLLHGTTSCAAGWRLGETVAGHSGSGRPNQIHAM